MSKYQVRIEIEITSCDLANYTVEADSEEQAKLIAIDNFNNNIEPSDRWASDDLESEVDKQYMDDWEVTKL